MSIANSTSTVGEQLALIRDSRRGVSAPYADFDHMETASTIERMLASLPPHLAIDDPIVRAAEQKALDDLYRRRTSRARAVYSHLAGIVEDATLDKLTAYGSKKVTDQELLLAQLIIEMSAFRKAMGVPPA